VIKLTVFIIALLLAVEAIEAEPPWLVTLAVLSGIELVRWGPLSRPRFFRPWRRAHAGWWDDD
jgi:hypothetical protein